MDSKLRARSCFTQKFIPSRLRDGDRLRCKSERQNDQMTTNQTQSELLKASSRFASPEDIQNLLKQNPGDCATSDCHGRLPLHYVVRSSNWLQARGNHPTDAFDFADLSNILLDQRYEQMVLAVCRANPKALTHEDIHGCTPIEYALMDGTPARLVKLMQRLAMKHKHAERRLQREQKGQV